MKEIEVECQQDYLFNFPNINSPFRIQLSLNKAMLTIEVDTGATSSRINYATYQKLWPRKDTFNAPSLLKTTARLRYYTEIQIEVLASLQVDVTYKDQEAILTLCWRWPEPSRSGLAQAYQT